MTREQMIDEAVRRATGRIGLQTYLRHMTEGPKYCGSCLDMLHRIRREFCRIARRERCTYKSENCVVC